MRCFLVLLLLTACTESRVIDDFDSGPAREDAAGSDAPAFDAQRFDVAPPRRDGGARDAGPVSVDSGSFFDAGRDTTAPFDVRAECLQLCERAEMCIVGTDVGDCINGCFDIEEFVGDPDCALLAYNLFRCAAGTSCEELERAFDGGACSDVVEEFGDVCGEF